MRALALLAALAPIAGCGVSPVGDFDGVDFLPVGTAFAVADRHDILQRDGSLVPVLRNERGQRLHLFFTGATLEPTDDWGRYPAARLVELKSRLALEDGLLILNAPLLRAIEEPLALSLDGKGDTGAGAFDGAMVVAPPDDEEIGAQALGDQVTMTLFVDAIPQPARAGAVSGRIEIKRERAPGQDGEVAAGEVTVHFTAPLVAERLGEANLAVAAGVMQCAARRGPLRAGACRDEPALPYFDETGTVSGR